MTSVHSSFALNFSVQNEQRARLEIARVLKEVEAEREKQAQLKRALRHRATQQRQSPFVVNMPASPLEPLRRFERITFEGDEEDKELEKACEDTENEHKELRVNKEDRTGNTAHASTPASSASAAERNLAGGGGRDMNRREAIDAQRFRTASPVPSTAGMPDKSYYARSRERTSERSDFDRGKSGKSTHHDCAVVSAICVAP